jgi:hypothetical protein
MYPDRRFSGLAAFSSQGLRTTAAPPKNSRSALHRFLGVGRSVLTAPLEPDKRRDAAAALIVRLP